jgi:hypothetical protein
MKLYFYSDPGHGWLSVSRKTLEKYIDPKLVSTYSYQRNGRVFLEEDRDAGLLISALKDDGKRIEVVEYHTNRSSKIRSYEYFRA